MPENKYCCLWWDCYICRKEKCEGKCDAYLDTRTDAGGQMFMQIQKEFDDTCEVIREKYRKDLGL